jgi:hypothetical protein
LPRSPELRVARLFLGIRVAFWVGAAVTLLWSPIRDAAARPPFRAWFALGDWLFNTFAQWDSQWFLHVARHRLRLEASDGLLPAVPAGRAARPRLRSVLLIGFASMGAAAAVGFAHHVWIA